MSEITIYQTESGSVEVRLEREMLWLSLNQLSELFERDKSVISRHLRNVFKEGELDRKATVAKKATVQQEGEREVLRDIEFFNLDAVISVGYRVNSARATHFRQWATKILRQHLTQGYTLNRQRFEENARELEAALALVRKAAANPALAAETGRGLVDIVTRYTQTFLLLQRYDEGLLTEPQTVAGGKLLTENEAKVSLANLKHDLMGKGEATDLFARERGDGLGALLGNLDQTVFGEPVYPSIEAKAAHLLYFVIKNHPFSDGNKRSGAFLFVDFLNRNHRLLNEAGEPVINDIGLAALALLVAESAADQKETMIRLIMNMLAGCR
ncbi:MAG: virulence protein RhuM/Fic/DOC family protein [Mariprofundales bacterium]